MSLELTQEDLDKINMANQLENAFEQIRLMHQDKIDELLNGICTRVGPNATPDELKVFASKLPPSFYRSEMNTLANQRKEAEEWASEHY